VGLALIIRLARVAASSHLRSVANFYRDDQVTTRAEAPRKSHGERRGNGPFAPLVSRDTEGGRSRRYQLLEGWNPPPSDEQDPREHGLRYAKKIIDLRASRTPNRSRGSHREARCAAFSSFGGGERSVWVGAHRVPDHDAALNSTEPRGRGAHHWH